MGTMQSMGQASNVQNVESLLTSEVIRVDNVLMSRDGRFVITGSSTGPPQIWDMRVSQVKVLWNPFKHAVIKVL